MAKRKPLSKKQSDRNFRKGDKVHGKNLLAVPYMRGGIRL